MVIRAIIFDLGGVLFDIDSVASRQAFSDCGIELNQDFIIGPPGSWLDRYERGQLTSEQFLQFLVSLSTKKVSMETVKQACCQMLVDMPAERLALLQQLSAQYDLFLLSNTFEVHINYIERYLQNTFDLSGLDQLFKVPYVSFKMGKRKPELAIYQQVISEQHLDPQQTLFIDDRIENIEAAKACGLQTLHKPQSEELVAVLPPLLS